MRAIGRPWIFAALGITAVPACMHAKPARVDQAPLRGDTLTASDWAFALEAPVWPGICGEGARGDTLGRIARATSWDLDQGDYARMGRMLRYLWRRGCDPAIVSPQEIDFVVICLTGNWRAWREIAVESANWRSPPRLRREVLAAAETAFRVRPHPLCGTTPRDSTRSNDGW